MLTADCVAAFLVHCVLWAAWAWLRATSIAQVLTLATVTALLVGLLTNPGPLAVVLTLATAVLVGFRMLALFARVAATAATSFARQEPHTPHHRAQKHRSQKRSFSTRRTRVLNCGVCAFAALAFPTIAGFAAATVHSVPLWPTDAMTLAAEAAAWKAAAVRLSPPSVCALTRKRRRSRGAAPVEVAMVTLRWRATGLSRREHASRSEESSVQLSSPWRRWPRYRAVSSAAADLDHASRGCLGGAFASWSQRVGRAARWFFGAWHRRHFLHRVSIRVLCCAERGRRD